MLLEEERGAFGIELDPFYSATYNKMSHYSEGLGPTSISRSML
jgi:hypothetical protein